MRCEMCARSGDGVSSYSIVDGSAKKSSRASLLLRQGEMSRVLFRSVAMDTLRPSRAPASPTPGSAAPSPYM